MSEQTTDNLIQGLTNDLKPVRRLYHPAFRAFSWGIFALAYVAGAVFLVGVRSDLAVQMQDIGFLFEIGLMSALAISGLLSVAWLSLPDAKGQIWVAGVPFVLAGTFFLWAVLRAVTEGFDIPHLHMHVCVGKAVLMVWLPILMLVVLARGGATTHPGLVSITSVLSVGALGYIGLLLSCMMDTTGHMAMFHVLPFVGLGIVLSLFARRIYRW